MNWSSNMGPRPPGADHDELDLATDYAMNPQFSPDFARLRASMVEAWNDLRMDGQAPQFSELADLPGDFTAPDTVGFVFEEGQYAPDIIHLGARAASDAAWVHRRDPAALDFLRAIHEQAVSNALPLDFSEELLLEDDQVVDCRGVAFPFSSDGRKIDTVLVRFEMDQGNMLELAEDFAGEETELLLEQEFEPLDMPEASENKLPSPFFVISTRKNPESLVRKPAPAQSTDVVVPQRLTVLSEGYVSTGLSDQLRTARELAAKAFASEERSHLALYQAIGAAYDLAIARGEAPEEYELLLQEEGLKVQERAEMTPVVKLVFGKDYDKTRITEYAAALTHAARAGLQRGELPGLLYHNDGGLKGIVQSERDLRRLEMGKLPAPRYGVRPATAKKLRSLRSRTFAEIASAGEEFALVMIRREADGTVSMLGEVPEDRAMLERASRRLVETSQRSDG